MAAGDLARFRNREQGILRRLPGEPSDDGNGQADHLPGSEYREPKLVRSKLQSRRQSGANQIQEAAEQQPSQGEKVERRQRIRLQSAMPVPV